VVTSFVNGDDWIWTDKVMWLSEQQELPELNRENLELTFHKLNRMPPDLRNEQIRAMSAEAGVSIPKSPPAKYAPCKWDELREMSDAGLVEIGSHSVDHPIFSTISEAESWHQLTGSRARIESTLGRKVRCFCFPNGMPGDYRESQFQQVRDAGYECAVLAEPGLVHPGDDPFRMRRIGMTRKREPLEIGKYLDGVSYFGQKTRRYFTSAPR
jgi:peptidoglycan/xylan/chitin deacetylase (PgdA/CDA1 family)